MKTKAEEIKEFFPENYWNINIPSEKFDLTKFDQETFKILSEKLFASFFLTKYDESSKLYDYTTEVNSQH